MPLTSSETLGMRLKPWSPTFLAPGTSLVEDSFSMDRGCGGEGAGGGGAGGDRRRSLGRGGAWETGGRTQAVMPIAGRRKVGDLWLNPSGRALSFCGID